jgi:hypothetical protein
MASITELEAAFDLIINEIKFLSENPLLPEFKKESENAKVLIDALEYVKITMIENKNLRSKFGI